MSPADLDLTAAVEALARELACLEPGEDWPSNEALGGSLTGARDDEYRAAMHEQAADHLKVVAPLIAAQVTEQIARAIEAAVSDQHPVYGYRDGAAYAARIAREWSPR